MALQFNPPPGWPAPPAGWDPPPGWQPDPTWPAAPEGWTFWVDASDEPQAPEPDEAPGPEPLPWSAQDATTTWAPAPPPPPGMWPAPSTPGTPGTAGVGSPSGLLPGSTARAPWEQPDRQPQPAGAPEPAQPGLGPTLPRPFAERLRTVGFRPAQWIALAGGLAVTLGSILPFVSYEASSSLVTWQVRPGALAVSFGFGLVLAALVALTRQARTRTAACLFLLVLGFLGFCGYMLFTVVGLTGGTQAANVVVVHWSPGPGILLCILGTAVSAFQSVIILRDQT